jgi:succinyl-CoA synthetase beta subunit
VGGLKKANHNTTTCGCRLAHATHTHSEGGTSIEDLAEKFPDKIIKIPVDIRTGVTVI